MLMEDILIDKVPFVLVARVLVVVTYFMVVVRFVDKMTDLVVLAIVLKMVVKLVAALIFLLEGVGRSVVAVMSVVMASGIAEVDDFIVSTTVLIIIEDLLLAATDLAVVKNIDLQVVELGGNFLPG